MWQQKVERGDKAFSAVVDVTDSIKQLAYQQMQYFLMHDVCRVWFVYIYSQYLVVSRHGERQCVCLLALTFFGLVSIIDGLSLSSWNSWYYPAVWFCYWSPCKQRVNTSGEYPSLHTNEYLYGPLFPAFTQIQTHTCELVWKREQESRSKRRGWIRKNVYFPLFVLLPSSLLLDKGFKNCPHQVWECFWYKAFWHDQQAEGKKKE